MSDYPVVTRRVEVQETVNPKEMARLFFAMDDQQQAAFFEALHDEVAGFYENDPNGWRCYSLGEMQWLSMRKAMSRKARDMYMALSAFAFDFWPQRDAE